MIFQGIFMVGSILSSNPSGGFIQIHGWFFNGDLWPRSKVQCQRVQRVERELSLSSDLGHSEENMVYESKAYPLVMTNSSLLKDPPCYQWVNQLFLCSMAIFNSYVSLPEGKFQGISPQFIWPKFWKVQYGTVPPFFWILEFPLKVRSVKIWFFWTLKNDYNFKLLNMTKQLVMIV